MSSTNVTEARRTNQPPQERFGANSHPTRSQGYQRHYWEPEAQIPVKESQRRHSDSWKFAAMEAGITERVDYINELTSSERDQMASWTKGRNTARIAACVGKTRDCSQQAMPLDRSRSSQNVASVTTRSTVSSRDARSLETFWNTQGEVPSVRHRGSGPLTVGAMNDYGSRESGPFQRCTTYGASASPPQKSHGEARCLQLQAVNAGSTGSQLGHHEAATGWQQGYAYEEGSHQLQQGPRDRMTGSRSGGHLGGTKILPNEHLDKETRAMCADYQVVREVQPRLFCEKSRKVTTMERTEPHGRLTNSQPLPILTHDQQGRSHHQLGTIGSEDGTEAKSQSSHLTPARESWRQQQQQQQQQHYQEQYHHQQQQQQQGPLKHFQTPPLPVERNPRGMLTSSGHHSGNAFRTYSGERQAEITQAARMGSTERSSESWNAEECNVPRSGKSLAVIPQLETSHGSTAHLSTYEVGEEFLLLKGGGGGLYQDPDNEDVLYRPVLDADSSQPAVTERSLDQPEQNMSALHGCGHSTRPTAQEVSRTQQNALRHINALFKTIQTDLEDLDRFKDFHTDKVSRIKRELREVKAWTHHLECTWNEWLARPCH